MAIQPLTARDRDALAEIAHIGAGHAAFAFGGECSRMAVGFAVLIPLARATGPSFLAKPKTSPLMLLPRSSLIYRVDKWGEPELTDRGS